MDLDPRLCAVVAAEAGALVSAWLLGRRDPSYRIARPVFAAALVIDLYATVLQVVWLKGAPKPFTGAVRAAYHAETALFAGWPAVVAAFGARAFGRTIHPKVGRRGPHGVAVAWALFVLGSIAFFPMSTPAVQRSLAVAEGTSVATCGVFALVAYDAARWKPVHALALGLAGIELVVVTVGPFATSPFTDWAIAQVIYVITFGTITIAQIALALLLWLRARRLRQR